MTRHSKFPPFSRCVLSADGIRLNEYKLKYESNHWGISAPILRIRSRALGQLCSTAN